MRRRALIAAAFAMLLALLLAGCGGGKTVSPLPETIEGPLPTTPKVEGDPVAGKEIFASKGCNACHVLADAGATGTVGPNLDTSKPDLALAIDRVKNGKGTMPPFGSQLSEQQIADVAEYIVQATQG